MMISLPEYNWFVNTAGGYPSTNDYTGSIETSPQYGGLSQDTLSYRVWVQDLGKDTEKICAVIFLRKAWENGSKKTEREKLNEENFECSPEGLKQAIQWLNETLQKQVILLHKEN
jgi:hypothetical protein